MLLDANATFSKDQDLAQVAGTYLSTNSIDLGTVGTDVQGGSPLADPGRSPVGLLAQVTTAFTSAGAATVQLQVVMADDAALTSNLVVLASTDAIPKATLVAGYKFRIASLPLGITKRYLGVQYVIGTATTTAGKITSGLVVDVSTGSIG